MSGKADEDPTWTLLFICLILCGAGWAVWHFFQGPILVVLKYLRLSELGLESLFSARARACLDWLWKAHVGIALPDALTVEAATACYGPSLQRLPTVEALNYYNFTTSSLLSMTILVAPLFRWLGIVVAVGVAIYALYFTPLNRYRTRHTLETFIKAQADMWPVISPIVNFNPSKTSARIPGEPIPDKLPPFAEALSPEEWVSFHRIPVENAVPDRERTRAAFLLQLGPRWRGSFRSLPPHILCLCAAFALQGVQKRDECDTLLGKIATMWSVKSGFVPSAELMAEVRKHLDDPKIGGRALLIAKKHAFRTTALLGLLQWARTMGGVLAPGQFLWLRATDRTLWYPLNNLGRRSFHSEGAGAMAHYMAEIAAGKALPIPRIDTAIVTLNTYFAKGGIEVPPREEPAAIKGRVRSA